MQLPRITPFVPVSGGAVDPGQQQWHESARDVRILHREPHRLAQCIPREVLGLDATREVEQAGARLRLSRGGNAHVATIRETSPGSWEYAIGPAAGSGSAATAEAAFDAITAFAASQGFEVDPRPSPLLDGDA